MRCLSFGFLRPSVIQLYGANTITIGSSARNNYTALPKTGKLILRIWFSIRENCQDCRSRSPIEAGGRQFLQNGEGLAVVFLCLVQIPASLCDQAKIVQAAGHIEATALNGVTGGDREDSRGDAMILSSR